VERLDKMTGRPATGPAQTGNRREKAERVEPVERPAAEKAEAGVGGGPRQEMLNKKTTEPVTMESVLEPDNLRAAWLAVKTNNGSPGVDGMDVEQTAQHLRTHWEAIAAKLRAGSYTPASVKAVELPKASGGKRTLGIPNVQDRLIQQALHQRLSPVWEPDFSDHSHGFRPGRSAHDAVREAQQYIGQGKEWVVDIDLKGFFDEVNHDKLMVQVARKVRDKRVLRLIGEYLRAPQQNAEGRKKKRGKGTPQGGPLSPLLANIYLDPLDKELEKRGVSFVRYADDIAIYASSPRAAERLLESVSRWIEKNLKVEVNREKSGSGPTDATSLLGFRCYRDGRLGVSPKAVRRLKQEVRRLWDARQSLTSEQLRDQWRAYITGWWNYFELADRRWEVEDLTGWIRRHMRKCFWLRWHCPRGRRKALSRLGVRGRALGNSSSKRGAWPMARHWVMHQALDNRTLERYGLTVPWNLAGAAC
jgi:group II intron reverse transcriptase/maturase